LCCSVGQRQRTHQVEQRAGGIYVKLNLEGKLASDEYAHKHECGLRIQTGHLRLRWAGGKAAGGRACGWVHGWVSGCAPSWLCGWPV